MKNIPKESVFALSVIACICPFIFVIAYLFETVEPYNDLLFAASLMAGSFAGSILGIISLIYNRKIKSIKIYILSLFPIFILLISIIGDFIYSYNKP